MADIEFKWDAENLVADIGIENGDLIGDDGLRTAVILSLFTDGRAKNEDTLPQGEKSRRGWWADIYPEIPGDTIGSRLWLIDREKQTAEVAERARAYAQESLAWMIEDKVAESVVVTAEFVEDGFLGLQITIKPPELDPVKYRFNVNWQAELRRGN